MDSCLIVLCWEMEAGVCYCALLLMSSYVVFFLPCVHAYTHTHTHRLGRKDILRAENYSVCNV